jgi:hypothetical protein
MPINQPQIKKFANDKARRLADLLGGAYLSCRSVVTIWDTRNLIAMVPDTDDVIVDGSAEDGRPPMTGKQLRDLIATARSFCSRMEFNSNEELTRFMAVAVNPENRTI